MTVKKSSQRKQGRQAQAKAEAPQVAGGVLIGVAAGDLPSAVVRIHDEPSLFAKAGAYDSQTQPLWEPEPAIAADDAYGTAVALRAARPRCAAAGCRARVDVTTPFCPDCQIMVPAELRRALTACGNSRDEQLLRLQAARAIAVRQGRPTLFFDGRIRAVEHGRTR